MNWWVPRSMPLAVATTGVAFLRCGASVVAASRRFCAGVAIRMMSARAAAAMSSVMSMLASSCTPGSFGLVRVAFICAALSAFARIQHDIAPGARRGARERRAPGAGADHARPN